MVTNYGIKLQFGVPYRPQGQGKVERDVWLPVAMYVLRTSSKRDHKYNPFMLFYGRHPRHIQDLEDVILREVEDDKLLNFIVERIEELKVLKSLYIVIAVANNEKYQQKLLTHYKKGLQNRRFPLVMWL
ncbi:hypothetical protein BDF20DRAFT_839884 [Mycotypha africana]|uniref:uncharacterized protein n=1 Tax=Mycotypha africana TaxID=64632 RepID=UPI00230164F5|nr:uncharacterized protein BDF20DRAFT_839884 [Mycotypha africana]KAI8967671.1 hypothetical protein BDF20DRAFT_839884 [Mycotypha africana]